MTRFIHVLSVENKCSRRQNFYPKLCSRRSVKFQEKHDELQTKYWMSVDLVMIKLHMDETKTHPTVHPFSKNSNNFQLPVPT